MTNPWNGVERRATPCEQHREMLERFEHEINGNGKPGLRMDVEMIKLALYGDDSKREDGVIKKQVVIGEQVCELKRFKDSISFFVNPRLLGGMFLLSSVTCLKVLGTGWIWNIVKFIERV